MPKLPAKGTSRPRTVAIEMPHIIALTLPIRSARKDHGITVTARPTVANDMVSAASAAVMRRSEARRGRTAWVEYNCANVATPAKDNPARIRAYAREPFACPSQASGDRSSSGGGAAGGMRQA